MERLNNTDQRLTELEIKVTFTEDLLEQLDQVVVRQQAQIDLLMREISRLRQTATGTDQTTINLRDERPPHF